MFRPFKRIGGGFSISTPVLIAGFAGRYDHAGMSDHTSSTEVTRDCGKAASRRRRQTDLLLFAAMASLWGAGLGAGLGWGNLFITGGGYFAVVAILAASAFAGASVSHFLFQAQRGYLRSGLAGGGIALFGTLAGAMMTGWGHWAPLVLHDFDLVGPLLVLPCTVYGLAYRGVARLVLRDGSIEEERR